MIPILYRENETEFADNGIGRLSDAISCTVEEELNGKYELTMEYPISGVHYGDLETGRIILAVPCDGGNPQPFIIYYISREMAGVVEIMAEHISYLLNKIVAMPFTATSCIRALQGLKTNAANACPFTFSTTKSTAGNFTLETPKPIRSLLAGQSGSILDVYGKGEYEFDGYSVKLWTERGADHGVTLRYGKNITKLTRETDNSNIYTGVVPFWADTSGDTVITLPEKVVWSEHTSAFAYPIVKDLDLSDGWENPPTAAQLRAKAQAYLTSNSGWEASDNIKVSFISLWQTEEYKSIAALERVHMGDTVTVIYEAMGVESSAKVCRTLYNVLLDRYDEVELGTAKNSLVQTITDPIIEEMPSSSDMEKAIAHGTKLMTGGLGGYVYMKPNANGQPEEILIMDNHDYTQATKLWRFNKNGIGFSSTGYNGTYKQAWTMDGGFYTDWVTTGKMTASLIKTGQIKGQTSNSMTIDVDAGTITLGNSNKLRISAGNFRLDSAGNVVITGTLTAKADSKIGPWNVSNSSIWYGNASFGNAAGLYFGTNGLSISNKFKVNKNGDTVIGAKSSYDDSKSGLWLSSTSGISLGTFANGSNGTGFRASASGRTEVGCLYFFYGGGLNTARYGLWAKDGTHIGSGGACDFNSESSGIDDNPNYLRGGTYLYGGARIGGGLGLGGDLVAWGRNTYNIYDVDTIEVNSISASGGGTFNGGVSARGLNMNNARITNSPDLNEIWDAIHALGG